MERRSSILSGLLILAAAAGLFPCGCAAPPEPFVYESQRELKPGPGLFSGEDGVFTIYEKNKTPADDGGAEKP